MSGGYLNIGVRELSSIAIPNVECCHIEKLSCLIDKILSIKKNDIYGDIGPITDEINEIVYQIYDLTDKEIEEIIS